MKTDKFLQVTGRDLNSVEDRVMICGSMEMLNDFKNICLQKGLKEGSNSAPADFVIEKAFVGPNPKTALMLGQARGALIAAMTRCQHPVYEIAATAAGFFPSAPPTSLSHHRSSPRGVSEVRSLP